VLCNRQCAGARRRHGAAGELDGEFGAWHDLLPRLGFHVAVKAKRRWTQVLVYVPFARVIEGIARGFEQAAEGRYLGRQAAGPRRRDMRIDHHAVIVWIESAQQRSAGGGADRAGSIGLVELYPLAREPVDMRRPADFVAIATQAVAAELVGEEEDDIGCHQLVV